MRFREKQNNPIAMQLEVLMRLYIINISFLNNFISI